MDNGQYRRAEIHRIKFFDLIERGVVMSEFINTIDLLGEQVVFDKLVEDSSDLTEFNDNKINELRECAFVSSHLQYVRLPIVKKIGQYAFQN